MVVFCSLLISPVLLNATGKGIIGTDLTGILIDQAPRLIIGYGFSEKWTVGITTCINTDLFRKKYNEIEYLHYMETGDIDKTNTETKSQSSNEFMITLKHWRESPNKGPFISGGLTLRSEGKPVLLSGGGYGFVIWRNLYGAISYELEIKDSTELMTGYGLSIQLYYTF